MSNNSQITYVKSEVNITVAQTTTGNYPSYIGGILGCVGRSGYGGEGATVEVEGCTYTGTLNCGRCQGAG